jgi:hypothetical protein
MNEVLTVQNPALIRLIDVPLTTRVEDMNYIFNYTRIKNPDAIDTSYFALHYKEQQQETWSSCRGLLSDKFTVAKTDAVIAQIRENLGGDLQTERHYRSDTSVRSTFILNGFQIDVAEESDIDLVLFKLITNINAEISVLTSSDLTFNLINGFAGNHALQLGFGVLKTMRSNLNDQERIVPINNIFILNKHTIRLIHDNRLSIAVSDVVNVQGQLVTQINNFKRVAFTRESANQLLDIVPKKFGKRFASLFETLPENLQNYYYVSYLLSFLLDEEKKVDLEIKLREYITKKIDTLIRYIDSGSVPV